MTRIALLFAVIGCLSCVRKKGPEESEAKAVRNAVTGEVLHEDVVLLEPERNVTTVGVFSVVGLCFREASGRSLNDWTITPLAFGTALESKDPALGKAYKERNAWFVSNFAGSGAVSGAIAAAFVAEAAANEKYIGHETALVDHLREKHGKDYKAHLKDYSVVRMTRTEGRFDRYDLEYYGAEKAGIVKRLRFENVMTDKASLAAVRALNADGKQGLVSLAHAKLPFAKALKVACFSGPSSETAMLGRVASCALGSLVLGSAGWAVGSGFKMEVITTPERKAALAQAQAQFAKDFEVKTKEQWRSVREIIEELGATRTDRAVPCPEE